MFTKKTWGQTGEETVHVSRVHNSLKWPRNVSKSTPFKWGV